MRTIWTNATDYVVADNAADAHECVKHVTGLGEDEMAGFDAWVAYGLDEIFPWAEEEGGPIEQLRVPEVLAKLTKGLEGVGNHCGREVCELCARTHYFASDEWV